MKILSSHTPENSSEEKIIDISKQKRDNVIHIRSQNPESNSKNVILENALQAKNDSQLSASEHLSATLVMDINLPLIDDKPNAIADVIETEILSKNDEKKIEGVTVPNFESSMLPKYEPHNYESSLYSKWSKMEYGNSTKQMKDLLANKTIKIGANYSILMPPPNLTGSLHAGHAFQHYLMDTLSRKARLENRPTLWVPGVDHAGLQLEGVIDKQINSGKYNTEILSSISSLDNSYLIDIKNKLENIENGTPVIDLSRDLKSKLPKKWLEIVWLNVDVWRDNQANQASVLGDSPDYSMSQFTLDPKACEMVNYAFKEYWQDGLVYQGQYLINWSVGLQTAVSDIAGEIEYSTRIDPFVTFFYNLQSIVSNNQTIDLSKLQSYLLSNPIEVSTVRPETIYGDMAVVMHPEIFLNILTKLNYTSSEKNTIVTLINNRGIEINLSIPSLNVDNVKFLLSDKVERDFGTGCLKITPASDMTDYLIWSEARPNTPFYHAISKAGVLTEISKKYAGQSVEQARLNMIYDMAKGGSIPLKGSVLKDELDNVNIPEFSYTGNYVNDIETLKTLLVNYQIDFNYSHNVTMCERSKTVIEPLISEEMFVSVNTVSHSTRKSLKQHGVEKMKQVNCFSEDYQNRGVDFLSNLNDWCISRNLVWGHQIPVWYNTTTNPEKVFYSARQWIEDQRLQSKFFVGSEIEMINHCKQLGISAGSWVQEVKRLDTWFSSSLWPLTTFGYLDYTKLINKTDTVFNQFYPTNVMTTGKDIFNVWICRMVMLSGYFTSKLSPSDPKFNSLPFIEMVITPTILDEKGRKMSKSLGNGLDPVTQIEKYSSDALRLAMLSSMIPNRNIKLGGALADSICEKYRNFGNKLWNIARYLDSKKAFSNLASHIAINPNYTEADIWLVAKYYEAKEKLENSYRSYTLAGGVEALYSFVWDEMANWYIEYLKIDINYNVDIIGLVFVNLLIDLNPFMPFETEVVTNQLLNKSIITNELNEYRPLLNIYNSQIELNDKTIANFDNLINTITTLRSVKGTYGIAAGLEIGCMTTDSYITANSEYIFMMAKGRILKDSSETSTKHMLPITSCVSADIVGNITDVKSEIERSYKIIDSLKKQLESIEKTLSNPKFFENAEQDAILEKLQAKKDRIQDIETQNDKVTLLLSIV